jgi:hypothetical protein
MRTRVPQFTLGLLAIWASVHALLLYSVDRSLIAAGAWALGLMACFGLETLLFRPLALLYTRLSLYPSTSRFRLVPSAILSGLSGGILLGPIFGVCLSQLLGLQVTGIRAALIGLVVAAGILCVLGLILGLIFGFKRPRVAFRGPRPA